MKKKIVFATSNKGKLTEAREILTGYTVLGLEDIGCKDDIPENEKHTKEQK